jgi:carboxypeptidase Q
MIMHTLKSFLATVVFLALAFSGSSQDKDSLTISTIFGNALSDNTAFHNLEYLCKKIGGRLCGSPQSMQAVKWSETVLKNMGADTVYKQELKVRHWERGEKEIATVRSKTKGSHDLHVCAIGGSIGTGEKGITANVVEVKDFEELAKLGIKEIEGKIVFFDHPADPTYYYTFNAYGGVAKFRVFGAVQAARFGALAVIVRSATLSHDDYPHTGVMHYADTVKQIPAVAVSTNDADNLDQWLKSDPGLSLYLRTTCKELPEVTSYNVIGEIRGTEKPDEIIAFGGHLDSWDIGEGAHDDGIGVVQTMEVLRLFKALGIKPKHTIRVVVFMDEEMAQRGAARYAESAKPPEAGKTKHIAAIETDRGGFTPTGFSIDASPEQVKKIREWKSLLIPYGLYSLEKGGSGVDIRDLKPLGIPLIALVTDSQRYFDYQHAANDTFDKVNEREMQLGSASIAALVWLIDKYGL